MAELSANSGDPDQTQRSAASDLGLHCLPVTRGASPVSNGLKEVIHLETLCHFYRADKFCDFLFALLRTNPLLLFKFCVEILWPSHQC